MTTLRYYSAGRLVSLRALPWAQSQAAAAAPSAAVPAESPRQTRARGDGRRAVRPADTAAPPAPWQLAEALQGQGARMAGLFHDTACADMLALVGRSAAGGTVLVTETLVVEHASTALLKRLRDRHGLQLLREGSHGKVLLQAPDGGAAGVRQVLAGARSAVETASRTVTAHPNFVRVLPHLAPANAAQARLWNHLNPGNPGKRGADVAAAAAWTITRGSADVRVAVLDEGVDTQHPALRRAVVAERDFVDGHPHARPDGNDAHGTACAGIIVSRDRRTPGLAPGCSLVAARIARGDGQGHWVFDDFNTADAIDWCWQDARADVLSNSWGGGPPVDAITNAFDRARRQGRDGRGTVVVCATGNEDAPVIYPATLPTVLAVGASTPWDERKSPTTADGERWGSNYGPGIDLVAPGVWIACTDIDGAAGYDAGATTDTFNGTSAATPHVAAGAALVLSVAPQLTEAQVREVLTASCDAIGPRPGWDRFVGHGRLNLHRALRLALR